MVDREPEQVGTLVVGGGQAGLAVGYHLTRRGVPFLIVDANERIGDAWRNRWDSLRLFTPARYDGLTGMPFPGAGRSFPAKDDVADYLEAYAERFRLPIRGGLRVDALARDGGGYRVSAGDERFGADNVVIALSSFQVPKVPPFASELDPSIVQMHSSTYRNPSQLRDGAVLVVGVGNSGGEISLDVVGSHRTVLAGTEVGHVPVRIDGVVARTVVMPLLFRVVAQHVLTVDTPVGRRMRPKLLAHGAPLVRVKPKDLVAAGVVRVPRIGGVRDGLPVTTEGRALDVENVIWCTGFRTDFSWIDLPTIGDVEPLHHRGVVADEPGLYVVGLFFLYAMSSGFLPGVARDAAYVADAIAARSD